MLKCDNCEKTLTINSESFSACGVLLCKECNVELKGYVSLELVLKKIRNTEGSNETGLSSRS